MWKIALGFKSDSFFSTYSVDDPPGGTAFFINLSLSGSIRQSYEVFMKIAYSGIKGARQDFDGASYLHKQASHCHGCTQFLQP